MKKYLLSIKNKFLYIKNSINRKLQIRKIIKENQLSNSECPICQCNKSYKLIMSFKDESTEKFLCSLCQHIFSNYLNNDLNEIQKLFKYDNQKEHNHKSIIQEKALIKTIVKSKKKNGTFLDFGVGSNIFIIKNLASKYPQHKFYGCDLADNDEENYFVTYKNDKLLNSFDGISSHAVIEHLGDTLFSWKYFNKLLKPIEKGGGIMVHSFPSQIHFDLNEWSIKIPEHLCLFSKNSLNLLCKKTGFKLLKIIVSDGHHPYFVFQKVNNLENEE